jgi:hypothetical protein
MFSNKNHERVGDYFGLELKQGMSVRLIPDNGIGGGTKTKERSDCKDAKS